MQQRVKKYQIKFIEQGDWWSDEQDSRRADIIKSTSNTEKRVKVYN
jgi:hypothetical protein